MANTTLPHKPRAASSGECKEHLILKTEDVDFIYGAFMLNL